MFGLLNVSTYRVWVTECLGDIATSQVDIAISDISLSLSLFLSILDPHFIEVVSPSGHLKAAITQEFVGASGLGDPRRNGG